MQETIILQSLCNRIKGAFVENGHAMLTNQRFIYSKHSFAKIAAMGVLVNLTKGDFDFDIPISDITDIEETKRLMSKVLVIRTKDDEYKFFFTKLEEWKIAFSNVREQVGTDNATQPVQVQSVADELLKFKSLLDAGAITEDEYNVQKAKLLNQ
ncbi:MAG: SHOCT domain-containing protein [Lachnospiraceae bacterium]|nr:SHOCT domain-containing protein [Lachnospiraceae bacterium]